MDVKVKRRRGKTQRRKMMIMMMMEKKRILSQMLLVQNLALANGMRGTDDVGGSQARLVRQRTTNPGATVKQIETPRKESTQLALSQRPAVPKATQQVKPIKKAKKRPAVPRATQQVKPIRKVKKRPAVPKATQQVNPIRKAKKRPAVPKATQQVKPIRKVKKKRPAVPRATQQVKPIRKAKKIKSPSTSLSSTSASSPLQAREICPFVVCNKKCKNGEECRKFHSKRSYQWQYVNPESDKWTNFPQDDNTGLEESFCNPTVDVLTSELSGDEHVYCYEHLLEELTVSRFCIGNDIFRRQSTKSTVQCRSAWLKPFCIEWLWYWQDENGAWIQYAQKSAKDTTSDVDGDTLERAYEDYLTGHGDKMFPFSTHKNKYQLNFETMQQQNFHYKTQRSVRRRPKFQTMSDRRQLARQQKSQDCDNRVASPPNNGIFPKTWVMNGMTSSEPKLIRLNCKEKEYLTVKKMFLKTMKDVNILAIKRVQNKDLWDDYYRKRRRMKRKSKDVLEKQLWHGTKRDSSEAICRQNFDFRISGSNVGTTYGQGSYFHRKASYSNSYTKLESKVRRMFLVRVLVGSYIRGTRDMKRPPPKDPYKPLGDLHDSCVDNDSDPSIFVIFETSQVYPEYLVEYNKSNGNNDRYTMRSSSSARSSSSSSAIASTSSTSCTIQ